MNERSVLCRYLAAHPDWERTLTEDFQLKIRREGPYAIFNYGREADFSDPVVQEARGIILDCEGLEVVCWPFRKFGNYGESYADSIDWKSARVQEKVDGSIIKLWFSQRENRWVFSTNGTIFAADAPIESSVFGRTFMDAITSARNYSQIPTDELDRECTYIFELVGPETRVVVAYPSPMLYHIGTRNSRTGEESDSDIGILKPRQYPLKSLQDCIEAAERLNDGRDSVEFEGFVVVDADWHRVKIKSPDYLVRHRVGEISLSRKNALTLLLQGNLDLQELCELRPEASAILKYYDWQLEELFLAADRTAELARALYEEYSSDRGALAKILLASPLSAVGFSALEDPRPGRELLKKRPFSHLCRLIPPYASPYGISPAGKERSES